MRIAIDVSQMCYVGSGVARYTRELVKALLLKNSRHEFVLFAGALRQRDFFVELSRQPPWDQASWVILPLPPKVYNFLANATPLKFELLCGKIDLIHASDWGHPTAHAPVVTTVHDLVFLKYPETLDKLILKTQTKRLKKVVATKSSVIADSLSTKHDLEQLYHLDPKLISVVYPGISPEFIPQSNTEIERVKTKYKLPDQYILSLGTIEPRKNLSRLISACAGLELPLVLTGKPGWGDTPSPPTLDTISLGYVADDDLPALYSGASVFVYPSLYEGFGFPVLEAMACGTPVVTSNLSSLPEISGDSAILVNPTSVESIRAGIITALESTSTLVPRGLAQAGQFTWDKCATNILEVYEKIAHRN